MKKLIKALESSKSKKALKLINELDNKKLSKKLTKLVNSDKFKKAVKVIKKAVKVTEPTVKKEVNKPTVKKETNKPTIKVVEPTVKESVDDIKLSDIISIAHQVLLAEAGEASSPESKTEARKQLYIILDSFGYKDITAINESNMVDIYNMFVALRDELIIKFGVVEDEIYY